MAILVRSLREAGTLVSASDVSKSGLDWLCWSMARKSGNMKLVGERN